MMKANTWTVCDEKIKPTRLVRAQIELLSSLHCWSGGLKKLIAAAVGFVLLVVVIVVVW